MKKRAADASIRKDKKAKAVDNPKDRNLKEEETPGFPEDVDFKKFLGCGG